MRPNWRVVLLLVVLAFALGYILYTTSPHTTTEHIIHESHSVRNRWDTARVSVIVTPTHIHIGGHSTHDRRRERFTLDTIFVTDTTAQYPDTLSVSFTPRTDSFDLQLRFAARRRDLRIPYLARDSLYSRIDSVIITRGTERRWYDDVLLGIAAVVAWFVLTKL